VACAGGACAAGSSSVNCPDQPVRVVERVVVALARQPVGEREQPRAALDQHGQAPAGHEEKRHLRVASSHA